MPPKLIVLLLALLLGLQPVTTDLYLPALPAITEGFGAGMGQAQLTLTALLLAFGLSQLVWGPLSDRYGRKPILLWGMAAYVLASVACAFAPNMAWLVAGRALQGVAMGAGVMAARAVVRDLYAPAQGATVMSQALTGLGIIACACAPIGGILTDTLGWRVALLVLAVFGAVTFALVLVRFEETLARPNPHALHLRSLLRANWQILQHPTFRAWNALSTGSYMGLFTFLACSAFVFTRSMGYSKTAYGFFMLSMSLSYIVGTFWCRWMLRRTSVHRAVAVAAVLTLTGGVSMAALAYAGQGQDWYGAAMRHGADLSVHAGPRRAPVLRAKRGCGTFPRAGGHGLGTQRFFDDAGGLFHGQLAGHTNARARFCAGPWPAAVERVHCPGGLDPGAAPRTLCPPACPRLSDPP